MKTLIFSDTHLTAQFNQSKFDLLKKIITEAEVVIINGDFWDSYVCTFDEFISSQWNNLFPLLKERNAIYLYGNHDSQEVNDERVALFSVQQKEIHEVPWKEQTLHIEHGNKLDPLFGQTHTSTWTKPLLFLYDWFEINGVRKFGDKFLYLYWPKWLVSLIIQAKVKRMDSNTIFIFGHTHWPLFDLKGRCINSGVIKNGKAVYLTLEDSIVMHQEEYLFSYK